MRHMRSTHPISGVSRDSGSTSKRTLAAGTKRKRKETSPENEQLNDESLVERDENSEFPGVGQNLENFAQFSLVPILASAAESQEPNDPSIAYSDHQLNICGLRDVAVQEYTLWQISQVSNETQKAEYQKACDVALADCLDLEQIYQDRDLDFFIERGVKRGVARHFVGDIECWAQRYKRQVDLED
jgi:hypothetical protein